MSPETERRRAAARPASNRLFLKISGRRLRAYSVVKHVGRRSGREYVNPVSAYPSRNGFVIPILYGLDSQWVRNVLATGRLTLVTRGREHVLDRPELIPKAEALSAYPRRQRWMLKTRGVEDFLWAHERGSGKPTISG
jgi:deazaflavin-dependent oxidoreductase (nitroreductase family)